MKKILNTLKFAAILLILAGVMISCGEDEINSLKGTKWKLAGIVDVQTGKLTELEPKDCEQCYTLVFETNILAKGFSCTRYIYVDLSDFRKYVQEAFGEPYDGDLFSSAVHRTETYSVIAEELKFFYSDESNKKYCLLFKKIEQ
ncbi:MAG: hypothetical protein LBS69_08235 [Prevotellaceae bacterium]|jgi:hypothetical protein|nr:hypothetical protein [Prevotellaceae bacterium]